MQDIGADREPLNLHGRGPIDRGSFPQPTIVEALDARPPGKARRKPKRSCAIKAARSAARGQHNARPTPNQFPSRWHADPS
jgi:hypothetical protein